MSSRRLTVCPRRRVVEMRRVFEPAPYPWATGWANSETTSMSPWASVPLGSSWKRMYQPLSALT